MKESLELWLAWRHLRAKKSERFISLITWLSAAGVAVGVAALIIVYSVMTGYTETLRDKIVGMNAHITIYPLKGALADPAGLVGKIKKIEGVISATPFIQGQAILTAPKSVRGVALRGIEGSDASVAAQFGAILTAGTLDALKGASSGLYLGKELAAKLKVGVGDNLGATVPVAGAPRIRAFKVAGIFSTGMFEYDSKIAVCSLDTAKNMLGEGGDTAGIEVRVADLMEADKKAEMIGRALGPDYWVADWKKLNRNMFFALELQRVVLSLILALIVLVAAFNVAATLIMAVLDKTREIGILKAMGAPNRFIRRIFAAQGLIIGVSGASAGFALGLGVSALLGTFQIIKIPSDIYLFDSLPVVISPLAAVFFALAAVAMCYLATLYPSWQASRLNPVDAIKTD